MRILHLASEYPPQRVYGLGRYVCDLSQELARQGHQVHVLTNSMGPERGDLVDGGVAVHRVAYPPPPKPPGDLAPALAFNLHLQQRAAILGRGGLGDPEVIVSHDWLTAPAAHRLARGWGVPHVWTVHDTAHGKAFGRVDRPDAMLTRDLEQWAGAQADLVLGNSHAVLAELTDTYGVSRQRLRLLHCGITTRRYQEPIHPERLAAFRGALAAPTDLLITYAGRLDPEKGLDTFINALAAARERLPSFRVAIAGTGALDAKIREHLAAVGLGNQVTLYGYLKGHALRHLYRASDIHVCPSHYEPFGLVAAEAMASGTAVIASATGGLQDLLSDPSVGCLIPPRDAQALSEALITLAGDPTRRQRLGAAAAKHVADHFDWSVIAARALTLYREACSASTATHRVAVCSA